MSEAKYYSSCGAVVTDAALLNLRSNNVDTPRFWYTAGELYDRQSTHPGESITQSLDAMAALAVKYPALKCDCMWCERGTHHGCLQCDYPNGAPIKPPKKVSENMIHARELDINAVTTVSELFELIDLPYRITKHARLSIIHRVRDINVEAVRVLRLEWRGDAE